MKRFGWVLAVLASCGHPPEACEAFCEDVTALYGGCLEEWGLSWQEAGYDGAADHQLMCDTWVWEQQLIAQEQQGAFTCESQLASMSDCASYFDVW